jgi:hypothetical protein
MNEQRVALLMMKGTVAEMSEEEQSDINGMVEGIKAAMTSENKEHAAVAVMMVALEVQSNL